MKDDFWKIVFVLLIAGALALLRAGEMVLELMR
jgi:hypothetical protein